MFPRVCLAIGIPAPLPEYRFAPPRRWRFDWAYPEERIALEVEGGIYTAGRHMRPTGFLKDIEKYNAAALSGWMVLRIAPKFLLTDGPDLLRCALLFRSEQAASATRRIGQAIQKMGETG